MAFDPVTSQQAAAAAKKDAASKYQPLPVYPAAPGQNLGYNTAGQFVPRNSCLAYAEYSDSSYNLYAMTPGFPAAYNVGISVPASAAPVTLEYQGIIIVTAAGVGLIGVGIYETTGGTNVALDSSVLSGSFTAGAYSNSYTIPHKRLFLGPTTTERQFVLNGLYYRESGSNLVANLGSVAGSIRNPWYLRADI